MGIRVAGGVSGQIGRRMGWLLAIIAVAIPALEMVGIYQIAQHIGWGWTLVWLLWAMWAGAALIRAQHVDLPARMRQAAERGENPFGAIWASGRRILAGVLLILPGAGSDLLALLLLLWPTARVPAEGASDGFVNPPPSPPPSAHGEPEIIEGEFRRED
jgi:UPF0716 protein FxsA